ncbi:HNH endonuclease signature motif containing protein [Lentzea sp. HUAS12]|uniref:HNH endonuclease signature motif containing protein n=1 Tax=Lentzea sp. HUAS12 TaxID=2951806 RepID=UPI00209EDB6F|nr:HNH endonuclease signature motif containing protein [Lentzea sp. HUAS12]USX48662.1 HNH endonuclease [Lentzea sp. HUAS12]
MGLGDITADAVRAALAEHDRMGLPDFCDHHGFDRLRNYVIAAGGRRYGSRVITAAAHGHLPGLAPLHPSDVADDEVVNEILKSLGFEVKELRPPPWSREELILACSQLFSNNRVAQKAKEPAVQELAVLLRQLPFHAPQDRGHSFRSVNSVQRKLYDLETSLPNYAKKKTRGGALDEIIVEEFVADEITMHRQAAAIRAAHIPRAWALFSAEDNRKYSGNTGYPDVLGSSYVYDDEAHRAHQVREGHVIVICDSEDVLGIGRISRIDRQDGVLKQQEVCPHCESGQFDERGSQRPRYRCRREGCNHEFDEPSTKHITVKQYVAYYGGTWRALDGAITADEVKEACADEAWEGTIRPLELGKLEAMLAQVAVPLPSLEAEARTAAKVKSARSAIGEGDGNAPKGGRRESKTKARNGQGGFRKALIQRYGHVCAITGPCPAEVLQAAHLRNFAEHETHNPAEGVLLRADVHLLFDNDLLAVDPTTWRVVLASSLSDYPAYASLDGAKFADGPCEKAITDHFIAVTATWS